MTRVPDVTAVSLNITLTVDGMTPMAFLRVSRLIEKTADPLSSSKLERHNMETLKDYLKEVESKERDIIAAGDSAFLLSGNASEQVLVFKIDRFANQILENLESSDIYEVSRATTEFPWFEVAKKKLGLEGLKNLDSFHDFVSNLRPDIRAGMLLKLFDNSNQEVKDFINDYIFETDGDYEAFGWSLLYFINDGSALDGYAIFAKYV